MSFIVALNTISMGFLITLITRSMNLFVALKRDFQRELRDLWTFHNPNSKNHWVYMKLFTKCKLIVKEKKKSSDGTFKVSSDN